jgi:hypothetical protein
MTWTTESHDIRFESSFCGNLLFRRQRSGDSCRALGSSPPPQGPKRHRRQAGIRSFCRARLRGTLCEAPQGTWRKLGRRCEECQHTPHGQLLYKGIQLHPEKWEFLAQYPPSGGSNVRAGDILLYRLIGYEGRPVSKIRIPMRSGLYGSF